MVSVSIVSALATNRGMGKDGNGRALEEGLKIAGALDKQEIFIMGGSLFYAQAMKYVNKLYLTIVDGHYEPEEFFPHYDSFTQILHTEKGIAGKYSYTFTILEK